MAARWLDPGLTAVGNRFDDSVPAIASRVRRAGSNGLTRQRERQIQRSAVRQARYSVALRANAVDADQCRFGRSSLGRLRRALVHSATVKAQPDDRT
jgi:hypothetical protein